LKRTQRKRKEKKSRHFTGDFGSEKKMAKNEGKIGEKMGKEKVKK